MAHDLSIARGQDLQNLDSANKSWCGSEYDMKTVNKNKWSQEVTKHSNALDLEAGVFTWKDPKKIAESLMGSVLKSHRRKGAPYQSAMSMLNFYINRAGKKLSKEQKEILTQAKYELKVLYKN